MITIDNQRKYAFWFGIAFVFLLFIAFLLVFLLEIYKIPTLFGLFEFFFRVVLAASLAGVAAMIPGYFDIDWTNKLGIRAGGAFAVFLLVYMINPPRIMSDYSEEAEISDLFIGCDQLKGGTEPNADTEAYCKEIFANFPQHWEAQLAMAKLSSAKKKRTESLEFALNAVALFHNETGESFFSTIRDPDSPNFHDATRIMHSLQNSAWGSGSFGFASFLLQHQEQAKMLTLEEANFYRKFNAGQAIIHHILSFPEDALTHQLETDFDYELYYDACLLSWKNSLNPSEELRTAAIEKYSLAKQRIWGRDGINAAVQRIHLECLENDAHNFGQSCGQSIGVPKFCPIFQILE